LDNVIQTSEVNPSNFKVLQTVALLPRPPEHTARHMETKQTLLQKKNTEIQKKDKYPAFSPRLFS